MNKFPAVISIFLVSVWAHVSVYAAAPAAVSLTPAAAASVVNEAVSFTTVVSDAAGYADVQYVLLNVNYGISGVNGFLGYYVRGANRLYVMDENGAWAGGYAPGSANTIETGSVKLNCAQTSVTGAGSTLTVTWNVVFKSGCAGDKPAYILSADNAGASNGWQWMGTWSVLGVYQLSYGMTALGTISAANEKDEYTFSGTSGDVITVRFAKISGTISYLNVDLVAPSGATAASSYTGVLDAALTATGTYKVKVRDYYNANTGGYGVSLQRRKNPVGAAALTFGQAASGSINAPAYMAAYTVSANANDTLAFRWIKVVGNAYVQIDVYDPAGVRIISSYSGNIDKKLSLSGVYTVLVSDYYRTGTCTFGLMVQRMNNPAGAAALAYGQAVSGAVTVPAGTVTYTVSANANDTLALRWAKVAGTAAYVRIEVYDPAGTRILSSYTGNIDTKVTLSGTYTILVMDYFQINACTFGLTAQRINNPALAMPLTVGETVTGNITVPAQAVAYTFNATANDTLAFSWKKLSGNVSYVRAEIYDAAGTKIVSSYTGSAGAMPAKSGMNTVLIMDYFQLGACGFEFKYDVTGAGLTNTTTASYTYDTLNRLTGSNATQQTAYSYDGLGNRLSIAQ